MNKLESLRPRILLSVQRALLGEISTFLRGITCEWDETKITINCYFDGDPSEADQESMDTVAAEVTADFPNHAVEIEYFRVDAPKPLPTAPHSTWVYRRKELT
jgi:hypothetical protein